MKLKTLILAGVLALVAAGCSSYDEHNDLRIVKIPAGCNLDSITIKDNKVIDIQYHEKEYWERSNTPRKLYRFQVEEKPWQ